MIHYFKKDDEILPIVDEDGEVYGIMTRDEAHNGSKILHPVVAVLMFDKDGKLILQKRPLNKTVEPGKYDGTATGHIKYKETALYAAERECVEEVGTWFYFNPIGKFIIEFGNQRELVYLYDCKDVDINHLKVTEETDGLFAFSFEEIKQMEDQLTPGLLETLNRFYPTY
jgi:isopentenyldiphosphate isomerase